MNFELEEKLNHIAKRHPLSSSLSNKLKSLDLFDFIKTITVLQKEPFPDNILLELLKDSYVQEASLGDYERIKKLKSLYSELFILTSMETNLDKKTLLRLYSILSGKSDNTVQNEDKIDAFFIKKNMRNFSNDLLEEAVFVHNGIFSTQIVSDNLTTLAYIAMQFTLIRAGFFTIPFGIEEYLITLSESDSGKDLGPMYELTVTNAIKKTDNIIKIIDIANIK